MPKKLIIKSHEASMSYPYWTSRNAFSALAEAINGTVVDNETTLSVSLEPLGYPDLDILMEGVPTSSNSYGSWQAGKVSINNKATDLKTTTGWIHCTTSLKNNTVSCYVARDSSNDTVVIGMQPGSKMAPDVSDVTISPAAHCCLFIGRDINDEVIYGVGCCHIGKISNGRDTLDANLYPNRTLVSALPFYWAGGSQDLLHLSKMINYLGDGYPEMKSAYIAVARGDAAAKETNMNGHISYYMDGSLWCTGGTNYAYDHYFTDTDTKNNPTASGVGAYYAPFDPWVAI